MMEYGIDYMFFLVLMKIIFCFFQAEDGIRDLVRSRGLGDVYKRQVQRSLIRWFLSAYPHLKTVCLYAGYEPLPATRAHFYKHQRYFLQQAFPRPPSYCGEVICYLWSALV